MASVNIIVGARQSCPSEMITDSVNLTGRNVLWSVRATRQKQWRSITTNLTTILSAMIILPTQNLNVEHEKLYLTLIA